MKISEILASAKGNRPVFSFEFFPPKTPEGEESLYRTIDDLKTLKPDFVSITYGAGGSTRDKTVEWSRRIKFELGVETMAHLTCVGASKIEILGLLNRLAEIEIENILALRGDPPKGKSNFMPAEDGLAHASELISFIRSKWNARFSLGAAGYPEKHPEAADFETDINYLKAKMEAGADFVLTQLFFDNKDYYKFIDTLKNKFGGELPCPVIPGLMPVTAADQLKKFAEMCGAKIPEALEKEVLSAKNKEEVEEIGIAYAIKQAKGLLNHGAPGIHFYTLNKSKSAMKVLGTIKHD